jgi:mono/diheme cytochrome c family protein
MRTYALICCLAAGCSGTVGTSNTETAQAENGGDGRDVWFKSTFGTETFLTLIFPTLPGGFPLAFDQVLVTPRAQRFTQFGVINDPDCTDGDASTGGLDRCADPNATGVVGIRKFPNPNFPAAGPPFLVGTTCAACHTGLDAENPPADPNRPSWDNIAVMPGNQYLRVDKIFGGKLSPHDPRFQVFHSWSPGTLDTTAIWTDHINNTLAIASIFNMQDWALFPATRNGAPVSAPHQEHGGQDDVGCKLRSLRVYLSEGMCARECSLPAAAAGVPVDINACRAACPTFAQAEQSVGALCNFMNGWQPPRLDHAPGGDASIDQSVVDRGAQVFASSCASCHSPNKDIYSDDVVHPVSDVGVNSCAARSSNWMAGRIWAQFSSDTYKARPTGGPGFVRDVSLQGVWASAPFLHNNRLGAASADPSVASRLAAYEDAFDKLLNPTHRDLLGSISRTTDFIVLPNGAQLPAGTPVAAFANSDGAGGTLCPGPINGLDLIENGGHTYGATLSDGDKYALKEYLKTL